MFIFACVVVMMPEKFKGGPLEGVVAVRYMVLLMGMFAIFCGFMYNDFAAIPVEAMGGSCFIENAEG